MAKPRKKLSRKMPLPNTESRKYSWDGLAYEVLEQMLDFAAVTPKHSSSVVSGKETTKQLTKSARNFKRDQALQMACLCRLASMVGDRDLLSIGQILREPIFEPNHQLAGFLCADIPFVDDSSNCYGILINHPDYAIAALRGTRHLNDWLFNFLAQANSSDVHAGVSLLTDSLWQPLSAFVTQSQKPILLAGHSLGGAVVTLATHRLRQIYPRRQIVGYTFGAPPIAGQALNVGARFFRLRTPNDFVPDLFKVLGRLEGLLPFADSLAGYKHSGKEYLIDERYQITQVTRATPYPSRWFRQLVQVLSSRYQQSNNGLEELGRDHYLIRYIELLNYGSVPAALSKPDV